MRRYGTVLLGLILLLTPGMANAAPKKTAERAPVSSYEFVSEAGDYVGGGATRSYVAPKDSVTLSGNAETLTLGVRSADGKEWWDVQIAAPRGQRLQPGVYRDAERASFRTGRAPGLDVGGTGRGCNQVWGEFAVDQIETDASGAVTVFEATFTQNCEGPKAPALKGTVRWQAFPLSYKFVSDEGDYIGGGQTKSYRGANTVFTVGESFNGAITLGVSGQRDGWNVEFAPPKGQRLAVGTYTNAKRYPFNDGSPGLNVSGNGRGCNELSGSFTITELVTDAGGKVKAFAATYEQFCERGTAALRGTVHAFA
ncbi:hypothetical protein [Allokutzneria sp. NRRL B-24872]|uniref:hypothetical protein n=1 Tax=Allokutzneria sp. NRRL B-24872 TaxID=1137961 RepID=UPI000A3CE7E5|nr:hypothetical protein [Allokutzneria sp. NRRL B-24872]